ncbi:MAG TPA: CbiQ family ECF transporter T component [Bryobacteraceae bacterium]|nr:CbiQ family ECF transporter T component [Bryobacteraceae bacterium]
MIHRLDGRIKLLLLLAFLISLALLSKASALQLSIYLLYLVIGLWAARLPVARMLRISLVVIPFVGLFSLLIYLSGDLERAARILAKSYLSALAVMVCIASTPLPQLAQAARSLYIPAFFVEVTQLIYRYLFVLSGEIQVMRIAFTGRGGRPGKRAFQSASGMVAVLFGRAFERANMVNTAMLSRGFTGILTERLRRPLRANELLVLFGGLVTVALVHFI